METNATEKRMSLWSRFSYGMASFGGNTGIMLVTSFFLYFCTDSLGLSAAIIGTLLAISKVLDGVSDIIMGHLITITHSKAGKARFWLLLCAAPYGLLTFLLFCIPGFIQGTGQYVYLFIVYILQSVVFYTMFNISCTTLIAFATKNGKDRYSMQTFASILGVIPAIVLSFATTVLVEMFGGGTQGWMITAALCGVIIVITILWAGLVVKELPEELVEEKNGEEKKEVGFVESVRILFSNKYFWFLLGCNLAIYIYSGVQGTAGVYFCQYVLGDATAYGWITLAMYSPLIVLIAFVAPITNKFGARKTNTFGGILAIAGGLLAFINIHSVIVVVIACFIATVGLLPSYVTLQPLVAEAAEYEMRKSGKDITPMFYSCSSVGIKVGTGLGTAIAGVILTAVGYDGFAEVQSAGALKGITFMYLVVPVIGYVIMTVFYWLLDVEEVNKKERLGL